MWVSCLVFIDGLNHLTSTLQIFPERDLVAVNNHLIKRRVELLTTKLSQLDVIATATTRTCVLSDVVNVLQDSKLVVKLSNFPKVG